ncbi:helix-turn-helix transcriptional regulator [Polaromonas sp.]|uniref:helix-turn-helix transcriptional regulator n=1 Tax=Polaromonas sp. TaxID=1869339 RepID=UPI0035651D2B
MDKFENRQVQQQVQSTNQMLTPQDVSHLIKIAVGALENWRMAGKGPKFIRLGGGARGHIRYREQDVEDWMFENAKTSKE